MSRSPASLIEAYEDEYYPIPDLSAADMLRLLIDQWGISRQTLSRETGIAQLDNHGSAPRRPRDDATPYRDLRPGTSAPRQLPGNRRAELSSARLPANRGLADGRSMSRTGPVGHHRKSERHKRTKITVAEDRSDSLEVKS
jgi:hypothetical protein